MCMLSRFFNSKTPVGALTSVKEPVNCDIAFRENSIDRIDFDCTL